MVRTLKRVTYYGFTVKAEDQGGHLRKGSSVPVDVLSGNPVFRQLVTFLVEISEHLLFLFVRSLVRLVEIREKIVIEV